ncbi:MAG: DNA-3-methyladenine glycosylase [Sciscionella sp.]
MECTAFFGRPAPEVAPELLGSFVSAGAVTIRVTEVEAYTGITDPASHAYRGPTPRTEVMFGPPGHIYVYFVYGAHWAMNLVCGAAGTAAACLLRAGEVVAGEEVARERRGEKPARHALARGPGNLARAMGIVGATSGTELWAGPVRWCPRAEPVEACHGPRVGVNSAAEVAWRFWIPGERSVSAYRKHTPRLRPR